MFAYGRHHAERNPVANKPDPSAAPLLELALEGGDHQIYGEEAFRYFMGIERKRSERSNSSFLLLLVESTGRSDESRLGPRLAAKVFSLMAPCLRETDFLGWYHEGRVAGAVLTQIGDAAGTEVSSIVIE